MLPVRPFEVKTYLKKPDTVTPISWHICEFLTVYRSPGLEIFLLLAMPEFGNRLDIICLESETFYALVEEVVGA